MTITGLTRNDSGLYTVEINDVTGTPIRLKVFCKWMEPRVAWRFVCRSRWTFQTFCFSSRAQTHHFQNMRRRGLELCFDLWWRHHGRRASHLRVEVRWQSVDGQHKGEKNHKGMCHSCCFRTEHLYERSENKIKLPEVVVVCQGQGDFTRLTLLLGKQFRYGRVQLWARESSQPREQPSDHQPSHQRWVITRRVSSCVIHCEAHHLMLLLSSSTTGHLNTIESKDLHGPHCLHLHALSCGAAGLSSQVESRWERTPCCLLFIDVDNVITASDRVGVSRDRSVLFSPGSWFFQQGKNTQHLPTPTSTAKPSHDLHR